MNIKSIIAGLFMVGLLASCAPTANVRFDYDSKVNLRQFSTYRIEADQRRNADPIAGSNLNQRRIADEIDKAMRGKGYKPVVGGDADLVIRFFSDSKDRQQVQSSGMMSPYWMWYGPGYNNNVYSRQYEENRVVVNVYDSRSNDIIWQGWATGQLNQSKKERNRDTAYRTTVQSIMKQYPESAGGDYSSNR